MRLPSWLALNRRARRPRRRSNTIPAVELLEDRTLLTLLWDFDPGTGHLEFTTDDLATMIIVQAPAGTVEVVGWGPLIDAGLTVGAEDVVTMSITTGDGNDLVDLSAVNEITFPSMSSEPLSMVISTGSAY